MHVKSSSIGWITLLIISILLIISVIFAVIGSKVLYKPIKRLKNAIHPTTAASSNRNEFELIETHIESLLSQNNQLEQRVQNQVTQLKQLFMMRLLQGKVSESELHTKIKNFHYVESWSWLTVFSLKVDAIDQNKFNKNDQDLILFAINNLMEDIIPSEQRFTPVVLNDTQTTILITDCEKDSDYTHLINQQVELIQQKVKELLHLSVSIGISLRYVNLCDSNKAFKESKEALKYRLKMGESSIIYYKNLNRRYSSIAPYPVAIKNQIFDAIKLSEKDQATEEIDKFFLTISIRMIFIISN